MQPRTHTRRRTCRRAPSEADSTSAEAAAGLHKHARTAPARWVEVGPGGAGGETGRCSPAQVASRSWYSSRSLRAFARGVDECLLVASVLRYTKRAGDLRPRDAAAARLPDRFGDRLIESSRSPARFSERSDGIPLPVAVQTDVKVVAVPADSYPWLGCDHHRPPRFCSPSLPGLAASPRSAPGHSNQDRAVAPPKLEFGPGGRRDQRRAPSSGIKRSPTPLSRASRHRFPAVERMPCAAIRRVGPESTTNPGRAPEQRLDWWAPPATKRRMTRDRSAGPDLAGGVEFRALASC